MDSQAERVRLDMHRAAPHGMAAPRGPRRLAINGGDLMSSRVQRAERWHSEVRTTHECEAQRPVSPKGTGRETI